MTHICLKCGQPCQVYQSRSYFFGAMTLSRCCTSPYLVAMEELWWMGNVKVSGRGDTNRPAWTTPS